MCKGMLFIGLMFTLCLFPLFSDAAIVVGNSKACITLTEVYDYQCPHCRAEFSTIEIVEKQFPQIKFRFIPVALLNPISLVEAASVYAAVINHDSFVQLNHAYFSDEIETSKGAMELLNRFDLLTPKFMQTMHSSIVAEQLAEGLNLLRQYHANGVPFILITNGKHRLFVHRGETPLSILQQEISHVVPD